MDAKDNRTGICLGGGGALGFAHIGVLKALEEAGISPYYVSGASMGAIIGVMYAAGYSPDCIMEIVEEHKVYEITKIINPMESGLQAGLSGHKTIRKLLHHYIPHDSFEGLERRFALSVVDLRKAECRFVRSGGRLVDYVLASMSIPLVFEPVTLDGSVLIDGGMMNNLPVEPLMGHCDRIIGVDVQTAHPFCDKINRTNILTITYRIVQKQMNAERVQRCDFYLSFPELDKFGISDFSDYAQISRIGYRRTKEYIDAHPEMLSPPRKRWLGGLRRR